MGGGNNDARGTAALFGLGGATMGWRGARASDGICGVGGGEWGNGVGWGGVGWGNGDARQTAAWWKSM